MTEATDVSLTPRESEVLRLYAIKGLSKAVAYELGLSTKTVQVHMDRVRKKLGATNSIIAINMAREHGLLEAGNEADS